MFYFNLLHTRSGYFAFVFTIGVGFVLVKAREIYF